MRQWQASRRFMLACALLASIPTAGSRAAGFYEQDQSAVGTGRAFSGEAADQGAQSMWWNPAAIGGIDGNEFGGTLSDYTAWSKATDQGSSLQRGFGTFPVGGNPSSSGVVEDGLLPSGAVALRLDRNWSVGLSVTSPFDFVTQYGEQSWARYSALTTRLEIIDIQPTLAWRPVRWLSIGAGPNIEHTVAELTSALPGAAPFLPDGTQSVHADGWDAGFNVGAQLHLLSDRLVLGAAYRSRIEHTLGGTFATAGLLGPFAPFNRATDDALARFTTPWAMTFAARYRATQRLTVEAQIVHTGWRVFDDVVLVRPVPMAIAENYGDTTNAAIGADYALSRRWVLRAGLQYDPSPVNGQDAETRVPDGDRWVVGIGASVQPLRGWFVDAGASYINVASVRINRDEPVFAGTPAASLLQLRGSFAASGFVFALGSRLRF